MNNDFFCDEMYQNFVTGANDSFYETHCKECEGCKADCKNCKSNICRHAREDVKPCSLCPKKGENE